MMHLFVIKRAIFYKTAGERDSILQMKGTITLQAVHGALRSQFPVSGGKQYAPPCCPGSALRDGSIRIQKRGAYAFTIKMERFHTAEVENFGSIRQHKAEFCAPITCRLKAAKTKKSLQRKSCKDFFMVDANGLEPLSPCTSRNAHGDMQEFPCFKIQMPQAIRETGFRLAVRKF